MRTSRFPPAAVSLLLVASAGCSRTAPDAAVPAIPAPPRLAISRPRRDLDVIPLGLHVESFAIRNTGDQPLVVDRIEQSCGCVDVRLPRTTVPGGGHALLEIAVEPRMPESRSAHVTIHSNDSLADSQHIVLSWTARGPISVEPEELSFGTVRPGVAATQTVRVTQDLRQLGQPYDLVMHGQPGGLFSARWTHATGSSESIDEEWQIDLLVDRETVARGGQISVAEGPDGRPLTQIGATWQVRDAIDVSPGSLFLGSHGPSERVGRSVDVTCDDDMTLDVVGVEAVGSMISLELTPVVLSSQQVRVTVDARFPDQPGVYTETVRIDVRSPFPKMVELPVSCVVLNAAVPPAGTSPSLAP